jgi:hypothetical protein
VILTGLFKAAQLPTLTGRPEHRFLHAQVVRERNRVSTALRDGRQLILDSGLLAQ